MKATLLDAGEDDEGGGTAFGRWLDGVAVVDGLRPRRWRVELEGSQESERIKPREVEVAAGETVQVRF